MRYELKSRFGRVEKLKDLTEYFSQGIFEFS